MKVDINKVGSELKHHPMYRVHQQWQLYVGSRFSWKYVGMQLQLAATQMPPAKTLLNWQGQQGRHISGEMLEAVFPLAHIGLLDRLHNPAQ